MERETKATFDCIDAMAEQQMMLQKGRRKLMLVKALPANATVPSIQ